MHHRAFYKIFQRFAQKLDHLNKDQTDAEHLCRLIRFHILVKEWDKFEQLALYTRFVELDRVVCDWKMQSIQKIIWNYFRWFFSWFLDTIDIYSTFIAVHLAGDIVLMASVVFQFDMVKSDTIHESFFSLKIELKNECFFPIPAIQTH